MVEAVSQLKRQAGKDILVYGGASFVASLLENKPIDELNFIVHPVAIGHGLGLFNSRIPLQLVASMAYANGTVVHT